MSFTTYNIPEPPNQKTSSISKWLWIVIDHVLMPPHVDLLQKICKALNAEISTDVFMIQWDASKPVSLADLDTQDTSLILSFGIHPSMLGVWIDLDNPGICFMETYSFIYSCTLDELIQKPSSKKQLWSSMQSFIHNKEKSL